jgi:MoaA/NifB/PqqE/SkfB family radical SAM enzyme
MEKTERLDYATIIQVVDDAVALGAKTVSLSGGEPFLREDIVEIVEYMQGKDLKVRLYSCGIYSDGNQYSSIPTSLLEAVKGKIDALIFNYETIDAELYATIMGTEAANLALLDETIHRAIILGIPVEAHLVPMYCNYHQIPDVLSKLYSIGVKNVSLLRLVPQGRVMENKEQVEMSVGEQEELKQILTKSHETYQGKIRLGLPFSAKRAACGTGSIKLTVRYDGYVFPCEAFKDGMMEINKGVMPENVQEKRLKNIYEESGYLKVVREGLEAYSGCEGNEYCYGQFIRTKF